MKIRVNAALVGIGLGILGATVTPALADEWNKEIIFHFNQPVEIPGHVLLPGSYVFQLADLQADRNVVQIFRQDKKEKEHIVATVFALPDYRMEPTSKPVIKFEERRKDSPEAIHSWFYPGSYQGWEFMYAKGQRLEAAMTRPAPPASAVPAPAAPAPAAVVTPAPAPQAAPQASRQTVIVAQVQPSPAPVANAAPAPKQQPAKPRELPKTAGNLPLVELAGGLMLASGALVLRLAPGRS